MEKQLITRNKLEQFHGISKNFNQERVDKEILNAQQNDLKLFLGEALYFDVVTNNETTVNQLLLKGGTYIYQTYDIYFSGVEQLLAAYSYSRLVANNTMRVTNKGNKNKLDPNSSEVSNSLRNTESVEGVSEALRIQRELTQFIEENRSDYPLYNTLRRAQRQTGFRITRV